MKDALIRSAQKYIKPLPIIGNLASYTYGKYYHNLQTLRQIRYQRQFKATFLLNTIEKSGKHYLMAIMGNYLAFVFLNEQDRLGLIEVRRRIWHRADGMDINIISRDDLQLLFEATDYKYWKHEHYNPYIKYNNAQVIIHLYRNPLDYIVSLYYYKFKNRLDDTSGFTHPRETIDILLPRFIYHYNSIINQKRIKRVAYEELVTMPFETVKDILDFTRIPVMEAHLRRAIELSSAEWVKGDEDRYKTEGGNKVIESSANAIGVRMTSSFVRSGKIGEWKEYFNEDDVRNIADLLKKESIELGDFILD